MPDVRNNKRCIIDSETMAATLMENIKPFLPQVCKFLQCKTKPIII